MVNEEYFATSFFRKMTLINAEKTAKKSKPTPKGEALNFKSASSTIIITPAKEIIKPAMLIKDSLSLKATNPNIGVKMGMVAIMTAATVGET